MDSGMQDSASTQTDTPGSNQHAVNSSKKNPFKVIFIVLIASFIISAVAAIVIATVKNSVDTPPAAQTSAPATHMQGKATAIDVENVSNSISQSLGGLSEEQDFPQSQLDDKTLGL